MFGPEGGWIPGQGGRGFPFGWIRLQGVFRRNLFRQRALELRSMDGIFSGADVFKRGILTTKRFIGRGQAAPMSLMLTQQNWMAGSLEVVKG